MPNGLLQITVRINNIKTIYYGTYTINYSTHYSFVLQKEHHKAFAQFICIKFIKGEYSGLYSEQLAKGVYSC